MTKLSSSLDICLLTELLLSEGSLVKGEYVGVTLETDEGVETGSSLIRDRRG